MLLRRVSDALAQPPGSLGDMMRSIMDVASAALGGGTVLRVLTDDGRAVETDLVSDSDEQARQPMAPCLVDSARTFDPGHARRDAVRHWRLACELQHAQRGLAQRFRAPIGLHHRARTSNTSSPRRSGTTVRCSVSAVYRRDNAEPYQVGDDDLIQVLADRLGSAIADTPRPGAAGTATSPAARPSRTGCRS